jgi:hypothetical protein
MTMTPGPRKFALTAHVTSSVGWLGAVAGSLALAVAGLTSQDAQMVRGAYLTLELIGWYVLVPLDLASLLTGLVQSLGTEWGLFRHYWILVKLLITILSTICLLVHMQPIRYLAGVAAEGSLSSVDQRLQIQMVVAVGAALLALLVRVALGSPVLFRQQRLGLHGVPFTLYKSRTLTDARGRDGSRCEMPNALRGSVVSSEGRAWTSCRGSSAS